MLTCIARTKQQHGNNGDPVGQRDDLDSANTPNSKQAIKTLTSQIKGMAVKASGAYKCNPCSHPTQDQNRKKSGESEVSGGGGLGSDRYKWSGSYRRTTSSSSASRGWGKEMEARLKVLSSSGEGTPMSSSGSGSASGRRAEAPVVVVVEETEPKEWVAQVEPGVLITFISLPRGGNDLKRIRFSRDIFNKWQAQKWWTDNYEKVMELYNVQRLNRQAFPLPTSPRSKDEISKMESSGDGPITPPLTVENPPRSLYHKAAAGTGYSSSDSFDHQSKQSQQPNESSGLASTPEHSNISTTTTKVETSSVDGSLMSTSSRDADQFGQISFSNASDLETEWVEEDEPGVYITIRALPGGRKELRRVRFSRERFGEMHARFWWEENRTRIHEQYL